ncbi:UNVERIFIED_CONTAM: Stress-induced-phosphoprotein 1 [Sesamum latifolium]|uniref:Stress-induced-phosphoprotein 1 n=1 Tax=Sesamum latifolium TaxID=2727402 RepID=A0AAW2T903_9LAMI
MEKLKSVIPETLKRKIAESTVNDLHSTCSSLLHFFQNLPLFHQMVRDLTDPEMALCGKNKEAAMEAKAKGNECFAKGDYSNALRFYSQALRMAPPDVEDKEKNLLATLYVNRASSLHKLGFFLESLRDCSRALILSPGYAKAWFRRAKANTSLSNYQDAINDLTVSLKIETSLSGKRQIESELSTLLDQSRQRSSAVEKPNDDSSGGRLVVDSFGPEYVYKYKIMSNFKWNQCVSRPTKGRGMTTSTDIPLASLIHKEDPYAAIILKNCRETHCAFCFNELPADTVPCMSCSTPLYCSLKCQLQAGGQEFSKYKSKYEFPEDLSDVLEQYIRTVTSPGILSSKVEHAEHRHECLGMHWPAVLPSDVILAGRILVKHIQQQGPGAVQSKYHGILDLCQNYGQLSSDSKLEFHVYSVILLCCLQQFLAARLPLNPEITSEIIVLLSQIRVNSMAVVCMKYSDGKQPLDYDATSSVEQVQVAQAVYSRGSFFNHSCQPNAHAYFLSRTLFIRATEHVAAGSELELSYGPQVGQWDCGERRKFLEDRYSFICQCSGCAQVNLSDLVHSGYHCNRPNCFGVVVDSCVAKYEKEKLKHVKGPNSLQDMLNDDDISRVASRLFEQTDYSCCFGPGYCLSCGSLCDLEASQKKSPKLRFALKEHLKLCISLIHFTVSLQDALASCETPTTLIMDALKSIDILRTLLHPFNKRIAEVEDNIAQAFCSIGEIQVAMDHCQASIKILEKLYGEDHIVIGNELIKLSSIQLSMGQKNTADNTKRMVAIFSRYYGSHADIMFPYLRYLKREAGKLV